MIYLPLCLVGGQPVGIGAQCGVGDPGSREITNLHYLTTQQTVTLVAGWRAESDKTYRSTYSEAAAPSAA